MTDLQERLRRLLLIIPFAAKKPGATVSELARRLGVSRAELLEDLDLLTLVGRPPFSPDDFIDVYVEGERVHVALDQRFSRPPRLTAPEAAALLAAAQVMRPAASSALGSARKKLLAAVPSSAQRAFGGLSSRVGSDEAPLGDLLEPLARAASQLREVELDYLTAGRKKGARRAVRPYAVYLHRGQWYLAGFCLLRQGERLFRVDRISRLEVTDRRFTVRRDVAPDASAGAGAGGVPAVVHFTRGEAPYVHERFPAARRLSDGGLEIELAGATPEWLVPWILAFAGEASVVSPPELRRAVAAAAKEALKR
jgi:proteasome accessory factor C